MKVAHRQAAKDRDLQFEALAAFANMGDTPEQWKKFRLMYRRFFPDLPFYGSLPNTPITTSDWLYQTAEEWFTASMLTRVPPPALLWYRNHLRTVWSGLDRTGSSLTVLYGIEKGLGYEDRPVLFGLHRPQDVEEAFYLGPRPTSVLPQGEPFVDGASLRVSWKFGCDFQQSVFELMEKHCRWKAKICRQCGLYFVADKQQQAYCSTSCSDQAKGERSLEYFNREGRARRMHRRKMEKKNDL